MQSFMVSLVGLVLSVSVGAEPLLKGRVWLASGPPAAGVHVRLFDLTDLRRSVGTTTDEAGYFALPLQAFSTARHTALPQDFALGQNYPNPFNPSTIIPYQIPTTTHVRLEVFNLLGQRLATLVDGERPAGAHTAQWDATDATGRAVGAGVFIYRLIGGGHTVSRRMVLIDGQAGIPAGAAGPRQTAALERTGAEGAVYGLTVAGAGLIAYVDPAFRVGTDQVDLVLEQPGGQARMKVATGGILGDVNNDSQVDAFDVLYVALYSKDPSITLPNHGDISLGDVNGDGTVDLADGLLLALYKVNPSDPTLPPGIGQPVDGSGDDHGDTPSSATALAVGSSRSGQLEPGGDVDYFRVQVAASGDLTVHTTGSLDTRGQLEDSAGGVLASDDDGGDGFNFRIAHTVSAGTYYIKVEGYDATTTGRYTIHASGPGGGDGGPVNIPDANLRAVIAEALGKAPNAPITEGEMATLTFLGAGEQGIRDLTGLEFATNLTFLVLSINAITDLSPLSGLTNLTTLWLNHNTILDLSPLSGLTNLTELGLNDNTISDLSPLSGLTNLTGLGLSINSITDISPLSGLTNLTWLSLNDNSISDISPLVANTGLGSGDEVSLVNNPLSSTSLNTHIPALESRGVTVHLEYEGDGDDHGDTPSVATSLAVGSSQSGQLETGGDVDYFRVQVAASGDLTVHTTGSLDTRGQLEDSAGGVLARDDDGGDGYNFRLAHSVSAGTYYIKVEGYDATTTGSYTIHASGPGGDGGPVNIPDANLRAAIAAELGKAPNAPITPDEMATLPELNAANKGIRNLAGLEFATNLTRLVLDFNNISDLSPLAGLTNLTLLALDFNNISDLSPLASLTNLAYLGLGDNSISDISPLVANTGLGSGDEVSLVNNPLSSTSLNTHIPALESRGVTVYLEYEGDGDDHGDTPSVATSLAVGSSRSGQLETGGDVDYFRVQVAASGDLTVHTTGSLDTRGQLEDSAGGVLARDDDGGDGYNFRLAHSVSAGTYYIKVEGYDATTTGSYTIHASGPGGGDGGLRSPVGIALDVATGKMYWTDVGTNKIQRANLDGSQVETLVSTGLEGPVGIALDVATGKMYWTDWSTARIQRANLDGSQVETLVSTGLESPVRIALDVAAGKMYWTHRDPVRIQRANLDGSQVETLVDGLDGPDGIALDVAAGKMYWADAGTNKIQRANLDGSQVETLVSTGLEGPIGIALDVATGKMYWTDIDTDKIQRANLDGSQVETLVDGVDGPVGIALDVAAGKMYWADVSTGIQRANLDGSQVETLVAKDPSSGGGDGDAISLSISGSLYPASDLLNRKRPVE